MNTTNTTKTSHGVKGLAVKGYVKGMTLASHTVETVSRLYDVTPAIWDKAAKEANTELDNIFSELGL